MRIHIDKQIASPSGVFRQGERCDVSDKTGKELIDAGYATRVAVWLAEIADEEGYEIVAKRNPKKKLTDLLDF